MWKNCSNALRQGCSWSVDAVRQLFAWSVQRKKFRFPRLFGETERHWSVHVPYVRRTVAKVIHAGADIWLVWPEKQVREKERAQKMKMGNNRLNQYDANVDPRGVPNNKREEYGPGTEITPYWFKLLSRGSWADTFEVTHATLIPRPASPTTCRGQRKKKLCQNDSMIESTCAPDLRESGVDANINSIKLPDIDILITTDIYRSSCYLKS